MTEIWNTVLLLNLAFVTFYYHMVILILKGAFPWIRMFFADHGFLIKEETLEANRMVKDFIIRNNGVMNNEISKDLIEHCKVPCTRCQCYVNEQRKIHEEKKSRKKLCEEEESKIELIREKAVLIKSMKVRKLCRRRKYRIRKPY